MPRVCICQICTCGRHRCPHHPGGPKNRGDGPCLLSEYKNRYQRHPIDRRQPIKPDHGPNTNTAPLEDKTTNRVDYVKHPYEKPYAHQGALYREPEGDFDHLTNYTKDYPKKEGERVKPAKRDGGPRVAGRFEGEPTYRNDYRKWSAPREKPIIRDAGYRPSSQPFEGRATYTKDYVKHPHCMRGMMKPAHTAVGNGAPMEDSTGYREDYVKHAIPPRERREQPAYAPNAAKLDDLTTQRKDFTPKDAAKAASCKPEGNAYQSNAPFDGATTQKVDYQKWPTERPHVHEYDTYRKPEGDMNMNTTHNTDYTKKPLTKTMPLKPNAAKRVPGNFDDTTNYRQDFQKWQADRAKAKPRADYQPNEAPFEGMATYTRDFVGHSAAPPMSMKPADTGVRSDAPFEGGTEYRQEYLAKKVTPCPAISVISGRENKYKFAEQDTTGHKWYDPVSKSYMSMVDLKPQALPTALSVA